jgi:hypothetical protein
MNRNDVDKISLTVSCQMQSLSDDSQLTLLPSTFPEEEIVELSLDPTVTCRPDKHHSFFVNFIELCSFS